MINKYVISSLSEYIAAIEKYDLFNCISRGENQKYEYPLRSGIHRKNLKNYSKLLEQYHLSVETSINKIQDKNFLAFAQHHGMPTNLLDFSFSPLVSLYFSVDECSDKGFVYFINKSKMVNINKVICKKPLGWGMFEEFFDFDVELYRNILPQMSDSFIENREKMIEYFEEHAKRFIEEFKKHRSERYLASIKGGVDDFEKALTQYKEDKINWANDDKIKDEVTLQIYSSVPDFLASMQKIYKGDIYYPANFFSNYLNLTSVNINDAEYAANIFVMIFLFKMEEIESYNNVLHNKDDLEIELEFPFYFTCHPPIIDDRVRNQSSIFVFQPFLTNRVFKEKRPVQFWQKIIPDFIIEVENPEKIKKELDAIGINLSHIYCDFDSKAKYIVSSSK